MGWLRDCYDIPVLGLAVITGLGVLTYESVNVIDEYKRCLEMRGEIMLIDEMKRHIDSIEKKMKPLPPVEREGEQRV